MTTRVVYRRKARHFESVKIGKTVKCIAIYMTKHILTNPCYWLVACVLSQKVNIASCIDILDTFDFKSAAEDFAFISSHLADSFI